MRHVPVVLAILAGLPTLALGQADIVAEGGRSASASEPAAAGAPAVLKRALPSVVTIRTYDQAGDALGYGSGFLLQDGRVATNSHVVAGASWAEVLDHAGSLLSSASHAEALSTRLDLAILPAPGRGAGTDGLTLRAELPEVGESVWVIGSPQGLNSSVSNGVVSAVREVDGQRLIQVTAPISKGSSGGPIMDANGRVVGVTVATLASGQNLNFGVPARDLIVLSRSEPTQLAFPASSDRSVRANHESDDDYELYAGLESLLRSASEVSRGRRSGRLTVESVKIRGRLFEAFKYWGRAGERLSISLESEDFDPYLVIMLLDPADNDDSDTWSASDDDGGTGLNAHLDVTLPGTGAYYIFVVSYDGEPGRFELRLERGSSPRTATNRERSSRTSDRWEYVVTVRDGGTWSWDPQSMRTSSGGYQQVWVRSEYSAPQTDDGLRYDEESMLWEVSCSSARIRIRQFVLQLRGRIVHSESAASWEAEWLVPPPESVAEAVLQRVCI